MGDLLELRCYQRVWADDIAFFLFARHEDGTRSTGAAITFERRPEGYYEPDPTFVLPRERAQQLMDELWGAGLRPTQGKQSEGVTAAQARHLSDMRAIAFAKLNIEQP